MLQRGVALQEKIKAQLQEIQKEAVHLNFQAPRIIAHRGYSARFRDNTMEAFREAIRCGAEAIETDLQITRDGKIVLKHDLVTLTGEPMCEITFENLKRIEPYVPSLEEFLKEFWNAGVEFLLEIKDRSVVEFLPEILSSFPEEEAVEKVVICSFDAMAVKRAKELMPELRTSLLLGTVIPLKDVIPLARDLGCNFLHPCWESRAYYPDRLITFYDVEEVLKNKMEVVLWHEERSNVLKEILKLPVYGICTNDVAIAKSWREKVCVRWD